MNQGPAVAGDTNGGGVEGEVIEPQPTVLAATKAASGRGSAPSENDDQTDNNS